MEKQIASAEAMDRLACPVGLEIHAQGVPEIAVSVMAQFIQKRAEHLREKSAPAPQPAEAAAR